MPHPEPTRPLVFLHIPKTSGIAVAGALLQAARPTRAFFGFDRAFFGSFADFASIPEANRQYVHLTPASLPRDADFVRAHMSFSTLRAAYPQGRLLTVLREPVCRVLSHYVFWRGFGLDQLADWGGWARRMAAARLAWADFLEHAPIACQIDNVALRLLLWPDPRLPDEGFIASRDDDALLAAARAVLRSFDHVGVMEDPDFWRHLAAFAGAGFTPEPRNETARLPPDRRLDLEAAFTPDSFASLAARTRLDRVLWAEALAAFGHGNAAARAQAAQWRSIVRLSALA